MDILAARKKAAEKAREQAIKDREAAPAAGETPQSVEPAPQAIPGAGEAGPANVGADVPEPASEAAPAAEPVSEEPRVQELEMLSFRLGQEEYAVMVDDVKEVLKMRDLTPVPNAPDYILGVTALRGPILPVIDLSRRLGLPPGARGEKSRILVLSLDDEDAGMVVDRVTGVVRIHPDAVRPVPETIERGAEFLKGIARKGDKLYILLDVEKALGA
jgi:purine-binding chemotaxis protein CheW